MYPTRRDLLAFAVTLGLLAGVLTLVLIRGPGVPRPAYATAAQTATAAMVATQTAAATTPHPDRRAADVRALNAGSRPGGPKIGDLLLALWNARQSGGGLTAATATVNVAATTAVVQGVYVAKTAANGEAVTACGNTGTGEYLKCTLCMDAAATLRFEPGAIAASQAAALKPPCKDAEVELAYLELAPSFTSGSTTVTAGMIKQAPTIASTVQF